ncbi:formate dehydrogenase (NAD+) [Thecaphora frezii]
MPSSSSTPPSAASASSASRARPTSARPSAPPRARASCPTRPSASRARASNSTTSWAAPPLASTRSSRSTRSSPSTPRRPSTRPASSAAVSPPASAPPPRRPRSSRAATFAVFGIGCVGLAVIAGSVDAKAGRIIAVDTNDAKESWAKKFGATEFINPTKLPEGKSIVDHLVEITDGGLDYTFDCTGNVNVMRSALESCHKGWGVSTVIGVAAAGQEISTRPFQLVTGRKWQGSAFGGVKGRSELPGIVDRYLEGTFKVDEYITHSTTLEKLNEGFKYMKSGDCVRCVADMS